MLFKNAIKQIYLCHFNLHNFVLNENPATVFYNNAQRDEPLQSQRQPNHQATKKEENKSNPHPVFNSFMSSY